MQVDNRFYQRYDNRIQTKHRERKTHGEKDTVAKACQPTAKDGGTLPEQEEVSDTKQDSLRQSRFSQRCCCANARSR